MAGYDLGQAHGEITIDYNGKGAKEAEADVKKIEDSSDKANKSAMKSSDASKKLANGLMAVGGAAVAGLAVAVNSAKNFEDALSGVRAAGNASGAEMDALRAKALQLGADTKFSATEVAGGFEALIKAGLTTADVLGGAADAAVNLAQAERIDIASASEIAASAMTAFNLKASDLPSIVDIISRSASATKMNVNDFAMAMNQAGAVSKLVGLSFDDMALAITAMGKSGIVGSDAGTSLKTMLMNLQPQTKKQSDLMRQLGIVTKDGANQFFDAHGKIKSMADIAGVLSNALKGQSQEQKLLTLQTLFGSDAIRAAAIIAEKGKDGMNDLTKEMGQQLSVAEKSKIQMSSFAGTVENLKGSLETMAIKIGSVLIPVLDTLAKGIGNVADWFSKLPKGVQQTVVWILAIGGASLLFIGAFIKMVKAVATFIEILKVLKITSALSLLANPWVLLALAIVAAITLIIVFHKQIWQFIVFVWGKIWEFIKFIGNQIATFFSMLWQDITGAITTAWNAVAQFFVDLWTSITGAIKLAWDAIGAYFTALWQSIFGGIMDAWNAIKDFFSWLWDVIWGAITASWTGIGNFFSSIWHSISSTISSAWNSIWEGLKSTGEKIGTFFQQLPGKILSAVSGFGSLLWDAGKAIITGLWNGISSAIGWIGDRISDVGSWIADRFSDVLSIFSPSRVFHQFGVYTMMGYGEGVDAMTETILTKVQHVAEKIVVAGDPSNVTDYNNGTSLGLTPPASSSRGGQSTSITINGLTLKVAGNLDPTDKVAWRKAMVSIEDGLMSVGKEKK